MAPIQELKALVDELDLESEDHNAHDFVITHRALAVLSVREIGVDATLKLFRAIERESDADGLAGLTGVAGTGPDDEYLKRNGIACDWGDWEFPI